VDLVVDDLGDKIEVEGGIGDGVLRGLRGGGRSGRLGGEESGEDLEGVDHASGAQDVEVVRGKAG
jgi:hypothetical protein